MSWRGGLITRGGDPIGRGDVVTRRSKERGPGCAALALSAALAALGILQPLSAAALELDIAIDTTSMAGQSGSIVFDLIDGDGIAGNGAGIAAFSGGSLAGLSLDGDASGALPAPGLELGDTTLLSSAVQALTFDQAISLRLEFDVQIPAPQFPDAFALFLLDDDQKPVPTTDPTGADALLVVEFDGFSPQVEVFGSAFAEIVVTEITTTTTTTTTSTTTTTTTSTTTTTLPGSCGDPNRDDSFTASDALFALRASVGVVCCEKWRCDTDASGGTTASDALRILRAAVGIAQMFVCPSPGPPECGPVGIPRTYAGQRVVSSGSADLIVVTDGTVGVLARENILDWTIQLTNGSESWTLLGPLSGNNSKLGLVGGGLSATAAELRFDFGYPGSTYALFQHQMVGSSGPYYCVETSGCGLLGESFLAAGNVSTGNIVSSPRSGVHVIAQMASP
jgi:hypothetical protein